MSDFPPNDPSERPLEPQIDNPDIVRVARETPEDRSPFTVFGNIIALLLVVGGAYLAFSYYSQPSVKFRDEVATTASAFDNETTMRR
jgi:hypothetical protein